MAGEQKKEHLTSMERKKFRKKGISEDELQIATCLENVEQIDRVGNSNLSVLPLDYFTEIVKGNIGSHEYFIIRGHSPSQNESDSFIEITNLGAAFPYKTTNAQLDIFSDNASDTALGTGLQEVLLRGIDDNHNEVSESIPLDGLNIVTSVNNYIFLNEIKGGAVGTDLVNQGNITVEHSGDPINIISEFQGEDSTGVFVVPLGKIAFIYSMSADVFRSSGTSSKQGNVFLQIAEFGKSFITKKRMGIRSDGGLFDPTFKAPIFVDEKGTIRSMSEVFTNNTSVSTNIGIVIVDRTEIFEV